MYYLLKAKITTATKVTASFVINFYW